MLGLKSLLYPFLSHEVLGCTELYPSPELILRCQTSLNVHLCLSQMPRGQLPVRLTEEDCPEVMNLCWALRAEKWVTAPGLGYTSTLG